MRNLMWVFPWVFSLATCTWMYLTGPSGPYPLQQLICTMGRRWKPLEPTNWCIWNRGNLHVTVKGRKEFQFLQRCWQLAFLTLGTNIWAVLSDEQMSHGWSFSPLNDQQKKGRNKMRVVVCTNHVWINSLPGYSGGSYHLMTGGGSGIV